MSLKSGSARAVIAYNIKKEQDSGKPHDQSVAIALSKAYGRRKKKKA